MSMYPSVYVHTYMHTCHYLSDVSEPQRQTFYHKELASSRASLLGDLHSLSLFKKGFTYLKTKLFLFNSIRTLASELLECVQAMIYG